MTGVVAVVLAVFGLSCVMLLYPGVVGSTACRGGTLGGEPGPVGWVGSTQFM